MLRFAVFTLPLLALAQRPDRPCDKKLAAMVGKPHALAADFCIVTDRLIAGKTLVLSSVEYDDTQDHGSYFSIYELKILQAGKQQPLFEHVAGEGYIRSYTWARRRTSPSPISTAAAGWASRSHIYTTPAPR